MCRHCLFLMSDPTPVSNNNFLQEKADLVLAGGRKLGVSTRIISDWLDKRLRNVVPVTATSGFSNVQEPARY